VADHQLRKLLYRYKRVKYLEANNRILTLNLDQKLGADQAKGGPYQGLVKAKDQGMIEHICVSTHANADEILKIIEDGYFEGITISFNAMTANTMKPVIVAAYKKQIPLVSMNTMGGGFIPWMPDFFDDLLMEDDEDVAMAALRFNVSHKELTVALSGMGTIDIVDKNVNALRDESSIGNKRLTQFSLSSNPVFSAFCTGCGYCEPCPVKLPIKQILSAYNFNFAPVKGQSKNVTLDNRNFPLVIDQLRIDLIKITSEYKVNPCTQCKTCEKKCTQNLPIISRIKELFDVLHTFDDSLFKLYEQLIERDVYIWGCGYFGKRTLSLLRDIGINVKGFIDSNPAKQGEIIESAPVYMPSILSFECNKKPFVVIGVGSQFKIEIEKELELLKFDAGFDYW